MNKLVRGLGVFVWVVSLTCTVIGQSGKAIYENDFEKTGLNKVPDDFLVLDGQFAVREEGGNRFLELPGAPLDTFGVLFGPTEKEGVVVSGRIFGTGKGRRYPTFALGLNGQGTSAYKLQVTPAKKALELFKGDEVKASVPYEWNSGAWTRLRLQVRKVKEGEWRVEGKVWTDKEPSAWMVSVDEKEQPVAGRASIWGSPYATTPIRFDDLLVISAKEKP
ncbi:MAG: hypothetical protein DME18_04930 [Verrucomicrobia bacterium]|nr:MAG: hypothetical protein DME18_04930 [Verrucomicrobiota bacterium]